MHQRSGLRLQRSPRPSWIRGRERDKGEGNWERKEGKGKGRVGGETGKGMEGGEGMREREGTGKGRDPHPAKFREKLTPLAE